MRVIFFIFSVVVICIAPFVGDTNIDIYKLADKSSVDYMLFWDLRVPRVGVAFFAGAILSLSGFMFQAIFRNSLTTPFTLGVSSGATLFFAIGVIFLPQILFAYSYIFSFFGAFLTILLLFLLSKTLDKADTNSLLLIGIALSFFYSATLLVIYYLSDLQQNYSIMRFTMGSLNVVGFESLYFIFLASVLLLALVVYFKRELKLILTSYENTFLKGVDVKKINFLLLFFVSISVGVCVSITGPIGFVGLVIPHIVKMIYKKSGEKLILPLFFYGGVFLVFCDLIARNLNTTSEIPIGIVTAFIGAPFFIYIILNKKSRV